MTRYRVTFARVGRNHNVEPYEVDATSGDDLAEAVWLHVRHRLLSRDSWVAVDLTAMKGCIRAGFQNAGTFTIEAQP
jgi:hypothetical protein